MQRILLGVGVFLGTACAAPNVTVMLEDAGVVTVVRDATTAEPLQVHIAAPLPPNLPSGACFPGWHQSPSGECSLEGREQCANGEEWILGTGGCAPVVEPCSGATFPPEEPNAIYVQLGAGGDGSYAAPLGNLASALRMARPGTSIVLAPGSYVGSLVLDRDITLRGVCAERVILTSSLSSAADLVTLRGGHLAGVTLADARRAALVVESGENRITNVLIARAPNGSAIFVEEGATLDLSHVAIRDVWAGIGVFGTAHAEHVVVDGADLGGIGAQDRGQLDIDGMILRNIRSDDPGNGHALSALSRLGHVPTVMARNVSIESVDTAVLGDRGARLSLERLELHSAATGVWMQRGASVTFSDVAVRGGTNSVDCNASTCTGSRVEVRDTDSPEGDDSAPFVAYAAATMVLDDIRLFDVGGAGVVAYDEAEVTVSDLLVDHAGYDHIAPRMSAGAVIVDTGAKLWLRRAVLLRVQDIGVASLRGSTADIEDVVMEDFGHTESSLSWGAYADESGQLTYRRGHMRNLGTGVLALRGGVVTLEDVVVEDTILVPGGRSHGGAGVWIESGQMNAERVRFERVQLGIYSDDGTVNVNRALIDADWDQWTTAGVMIRQGATSLSNTEIRVRGTRACGLYLARDPQLSFAGADIMAAGVGLCLTREAAIDTELQGLRVAREVLIPLLSSDQILTFPDPVASLADLVGFEQ